MKPPAIELADVVRAFSGQYLRTYGHRMPAVHRKAIGDMMACRTPAMGGTTWWCPSCEHWQYSYHSCGNRNCNKCQNEKAQQWLETTGKLLLPTHHFMVTFTLPEPLRQLARSHQRLFYGLLMSCGADALQTLAWDSRFVGGRLALMGLLHTWSRDLAYHPHVHMIVAGGGLWEDEGRWLEASRNFLVPVKALSVIFAAKFRDGLKKASPQLFAGIDASVWLGSWVVHSQGIGRGTGAVKYLAQYVFRPAISNKRLLAISEGKVSFRWRHSQTKQWKITSLDGVEFLRRYLRHVLPRGFVKVRYYGVYAHRYRNTLNKLHRQLLQTTAETEPAVSTLDDWQSEPVAAKSLACPCCGQPMLVAGNIPRGGPWSKAPPHQGGLTHPTDYHPSIAINTL